MESDLRALLAAARDAGISITGAELRTLLESRETMAPEGDPTPAVEYAWPQLSDFRLFRT